MHKKGGLGWFADLIRGGGGGGGGGEWGGGGGGGGGGAWQKRGMVVFLKGA